MITQNGVPAYIEENLPEIKPELQKAVGPATATAYNTIQCLTDFTNVMIRQHNYTMVKRCLSVASRLYSKGNDAVKNALENVYVYSFSSLLRSCENFRERNLVQAAIPGGLYRIYVNQITKSGI